MRKSYLVLAVLVAVGAAIVAGRPASAQGDGVRFSLVPGLDYYLWDDNLGLKDDILLGGRLSADLGRLVSLRGYYLMNDAVRTDLSDVVFEGWPGPAPTDQQFGLKTYGADLQFNLGRGPVVPFILGGGGIFRFEPEHGEKTEQIATRFGFGTRFELDPRVRIEMHVEDVMMRLDRTRLIALDEMPETPPVDPKGSDLRHNISFGVGLNFQFTGGEDTGETEIDRAIRQRYAGGLFGVSWPLEPFAGRLNFDRSASLEDQSLLGIRTGVDLGRLLGLRAYYWHGMNDNFDDTEPVQSWGGEAQFNLTNGQGAVPYLLLGVGRLDFLSDFRDLEDSKRRDKDVLILGGGVDLTLSDRFHINLGARDNIFSETDLGDVAQPSELVHNWLFAAGLGFSFGGSGHREMRAEPSQQAPPSPPSGIAPTADATPGLGGVASTAEPVSPEAAAPLAPLTATPSTQLPAPLPQSFQSEKTVTLPVPAVGEIYVRYGEPGGVNIASRAGAAGQALPEGEAPAARTPSLEEEIRRIVRDELGAAREPLPQAAAGEAAPAGRAGEEERLDALAERLEDRMSALFAERAAEEQAPPQTIVVPPSTPAEPSSPIYVRPEVKPAAGLGKAMNVVYPYLGVNLDYPEQLVMAARLDIGPVRPGSKTRVLPEVAIGLFNKGSFMFAVNTQHDFGSLAAKGNLSPYVYGGLGVIRFGKGVDRDRTEAVLNLGYGLTRNFGKFTAFVEHQGVDFFSLHRLNFGLRFGL
jgi:hypothetical protein